MATNPLRSDPTRTKMLRERFERVIRGRFNRLNSKIKKLLIRDDAFGIKRRKDNFKRLVGNNFIFNVGPREWSFLTDEKKLKEFEEWLSQETGLTIVPEEDRFWEEFVEEGYRKGAGRAFDDSNRKELAAAGGTRAEAFQSGRKSEFIRTMLGGPETVEKVKILAARTLTDLKGVTGVMATQLRRELVDGLVQGDNPTVIARRMSSKIDINRKRAQTIARTEIIRAHAEGQLDALEQMGVERVGVAVEWETAGDNRVCPLCIALDGIVLKVKEAHNLIPRHPNCRCAFIPANVGESPQGQARSKSAIQSSINDSLRAEGGKKRSLQRGRSVSTWPGKSKSISKARPKSILGTTTVKSVPEPGTEFFDIKIERDDIRPGKSVKPDLKGVRKISNVGYNKPDPTTGESGISVLEKMVDMAHEEINYISEVLPTTTKAKTLKDLKFINAKTKNNHTGEYNSGNSSFFVATDRVKSSKLKFGNWVVDPSVSGITRHEYGHHIHMNFIQTRNRGASREWTELFKKTSKLDMPSQYGSTNELEFFAESFSAITHKDYKPGDLHKDTEDWFKKHLGWNPNKKVTKKLIKPTIKPKLVPKPTIKKPTVVKPKPVVKPTIKEIDLFSEPEIQQLVAEHQTAIEKVNISGSRFQKTKKNKIEKKLADKGIFVGEDGKYTVDKLAKTTKTITKPPVVKKEVTVKSKPIKTDYKQDRRKWKENLTTDEKKGIEFWSESVYTVGDVRSIQAGKTAELTGRTKEAKDFIKAIDKAPKYKGTVYRGQVLDELDNIKVGKEFKFGHSVSASKDQDIAGEFATMAADISDKAVGIEIRLKGKAGVDISDLVLEEYEDQEEIFIDKSAKFIVKSKEKVDEELTVIIIEEQ